MNQRGISNIEVLIVALIVGVLGIGAVVAVSNARSQTRDAVRLSDVRQLQAALELYFNDSNTYPVSQSVTALGQATTRCLGEGGFGASCNSAGESVYMDVVPAALRTGLGGQSTCMNVADAYCYFGGEEEYRVEFELEKGNPVLGVVRGLNCATETGIEPGGCSLQ